MQYYTMFYSLWINWRSKSGWVLYFISNFWHFSRSTLGSSHQKHDQQAVTVSMVLVWNNLSQNLFTTKVNECKSTFSISSFYTVRQQLIFLPCVISRKLITSTVNGQCDARPTITFPVTDLHYVCWRSFKVVGFVTNRKGSSYLTATKLYCLLTEACMWTTLSCNLRVLCHK